MPHHSAEQNAVVNERLAALSAMSFDELAALSSVTSEDLVLAGKKHTLSVWHDILESGEHRIVVQLYKHGILGVGQMLAEGFVIDSRNERRGLTQEEWDPFS
jgi:hypothetical protein